MMEQEWASPFDLQELHRRIAVQRIEYEMQLLRIGVGSVHRLHAALFRLHPDGPSVHRWWHANPYEHIALDVR